MGKAQITNPREMHRVARQLLAVAALLTTMAVAGGVALATTYPILHNSSTANSKAYWNISGGWGVTPTSKYGRFTCATCHNNNTTNIKRIGASLTPPKGGVWNSSGTATVSVNFTNVTGQNSFGDDSTNPNYTSSARICEVCHSKTIAHRYDNSPAAVTQKPNHQSASRTDCTSVCHPHSAGFKASGSCTTCHGNPPTTTAIGGPDGLASPATNALGASPASPGAHAWHYTTKGIQCYACHNGYTTSPMGNNRIEIGFAVNNTNWTQFTGSVTYGNFSGNSALGGTYQYQTSGSPGTTFATSASTRNSCNVYCHGNWQGSGRTLRPSWIGGSTNADCGTCHGASAALPPTRGSHVKHASNGTTAYALTCTTCHQSRPNNDTAHITGSVQWRMSTGMTRVGPSATYNGLASGSTGAVAPSVTYQSCNNVYCHSYKANDARSYRIVQWGATLATDCTGCHGNDKSSALQMTADAHKAHMNNASVRFSGMAFKCNECHASTVNTDNRTLQAGAYGLAGNHTNATATVVWGPINTGSAAYTGGSTCATTYCHSDGVGGAPKVTPTAWNGVTDSAEGNAGCNYCHGGLKVDDPNHIATKKHARHIGVGVNIPHADIPCYQCHRRTATVANAIMTNTTGLHLNKALNVSMSNNFNGVLANYTGLYTKALDTCANTYCHGSPVTPAWGSVQTRACGDCHGTSNSGLLSTPHARHYNTATNVTASNGWTNTTNHTGVTYIFYCGTCHNVGSTNHVNGPQVAGKGDTQLSFNVAGNQTGFTATPSQSSTSVTGDSRNFRYSGQTTCSVYCHSNAYDGAPVYRATRAWNGTSPCGSCHTTSANKTYTDWSPGHTRHIGSNATLRQYSSNTNFRCGTCHNATITNGTNASIIATTKNHVNGYRNVSSNTWAGTGTAPLKWTSATFTCTNSYCHSTGRATPQYSTTPSWRTGSVTCLSCHGGRNGATGSYTPSTAGFRLSTTHSQHLKYPAANMNCHICHSKTAVTDAVTLKNYTGVRYHVNKTKDVRFTDITYGSYTSYKTGTKKCGNVSCHGGTTRNAWTESGALNNNNTCVHCHGVAATLPSDTNRNKYAPGWGGTGTDTDGNTAVTDYQVGAHFRHLSSVYMKKLKCNECHIVPSTPFEGGHMAQPRFTVSQTLRFDQASSAKWDGLTSTTLSSFSGYTSGTATKAATCSSVYCHGNRLKNGGTNGLSKKPSWNQDLTTGTPGTTECGQCHGNPPDSVSGSHLGVTATTGCSGCHVAVVNATGVIINKALHLNRSIEVAADDCKGCHGTGSSKDMQTEFGKNSHHINKTWASMTNFDCVVCHAEGYISAGAVKRDGTRHSNPVGVVDLYNADNRATIYSINLSYLTLASGTATDKNTANSTLDTFCFSCHDSGGAVAVTTGNGFPASPVYNATSPFGEAAGSERKNAYDAVQKNFGAAPAALNVYDQFATTNNSHHAVRAARYTVGLGAGSNLGGLTGALTLRDAGLLSSTVVLSNGTTGVDDKTQLHCNDCHSTAWSSHGSANEYLLQLATAANPTAEHLGLTDVVCSKCHPSGSYAGSGLHTGNGGDLVWTPGSTGATRASGNGHITGIACLNCHDGNVGFGAIHGFPNATFTAGGSGGTYNKRRFMPGSSLYMYDPDTGDAGTDAGWTTATAANKCYTISTAGSVSSCTKHSAGTAQSDRNVRRPVSY